VKFSRPGETGSSKQGAIIAPFCQAASLLGSATARKLLKTSKILSQALKHYSSLRKQQQLAIPVQPLAEPQHSSGTSTNEAFNDWGLNGKGGSVKTSADWGLNGKRDGETCSYPGKPS